MSVRLDWEIEAEQSHQKSDGEDRESRRRRRMAQLRILLGIATIIVILGGAAGIVFFRLNMVDREIERSLRDTVDAEVATLRIADRNGFMAVQRSANDAWLEVQTARFDEYQALKADANLQLTGNVVDISIDSQRGRVQVEEIINGTPYVLTWFYWRYNDGWRHVPPDYTFWGDVDTIENQSVLVRYREVDAQLAEDMADALSQWQTMACTALVCDDVPRINVEIVPEQGAFVRWSPADPWQLIVPSPFVDRARLDRPFDTVLRIETANLLAERFVAQASGDLNPTFPSDAFYLRTSVVSWLVGRFAEIDTDSSLIESLATRYGDEAVGNLLGVMGSNADIQVLNAVTGTASLAETGLDWQDYLTWRLNLEGDLLAQRNEAAYIALYDTTQESVRNLAYERYTQPVAPEPRTVISVQSDGASTLETLVQVGEGENGRQETVIFRLSEGVWKRTN